MTVTEFIQTLPLQKQKELRRKAKIVAREDVLSGGNDMWLALELNINRAEIEKQALSQSKIK